MSQLSQSARVLNAPEIALYTGIPVPTVSKLLRTLAHGELVYSQRGAQGGYRLARPAAEISVADIVSVLEGPVAVTPCVEPSLDACGVEDMCPMRGGWDKINTAIRIALETVTLADMSGPVGTAPDADSKSADKIHVE
jgi:FeS assembly SUF system regulator